MFRLRFVALSIAVLSGCGGSASTPPATPSITIAAWAGPMANAVASATNPAGANQTFRAILKPTVSGRLVSVHFSNALGTAPVTIGAAHIGVVTTGAGVRGDVPLTFGGKTSVTLAAGQSISSDQLALTYTFGSLLAVTEFVSGSWTALPQHSNVGLWTNYQTGPGAGNATADAAGTAFTQTTSEAFLVDRLDVTGNYRETVAFLGSSTTAGYGSDTDKFDDWVDDIAANLHTAGIDSIGVVNVALIPDALLSANAIANDPAAVDRFSRDVLSLPSLAIVVQNAADVDLKSACDPAQQVIAGDRQLISAAHAAHVKIYLAVIAPSTYCGPEIGSGGRFPANTGGDAQRELLNGWITSTGATTVNGVAESPPGADAIIDIATPITDPTNTGYLAPAYNFDYNHVNAAGQAVQAAAFPSTIF